MIDHVLFAVKRIRVKIFYACLLTVSIVFSIIGLKAVYDSYNRAEPPEKNLFSLHSWIGLATVILLCLQWLCGFISCLCPRLNENIRHAFIFNYKFWSKLIFLLGIGTVLMGITEYSIL